MQTDAGFCSAPSPSKAAEKTPSPEGRADGRLARLWRAISGNRIVAIAKREPLIPFLMAGALIFAGYYFSEQQRSNPIRYTAETEKQLIEEFEAVSGRKAEARDRERLRDDFIADELMFREAVDRGMYLTDPAARERMIDRMRYLVVGAPAEPTEQQLVDYYASHADIYQTEPGISFSQVFFASNPENGPALLARLNRGESIGGDDFWLGREFPNYGHSMIRGMFGQQFLKELEDSQTGQWLGPIRSSRGWHFIRKTGVSAPIRIPYADARMQVKQDYILDGTQAALDKEIAKLKEKYDVDVEVAD